MTLTHQILDPPAIVNSLGLFLKLMVQFFAVPDLHVTRPNFIVSTGTLVMSFTEKVRTEFGFDDSMFLAVSKYKSAAVGRLLGSDEILPNCRIRVDCARYEMPQRVDEYHSKAADWTLWVVEVWEVHRLSHGRRVRTLGFWEFTASKTVGEFMGRLAPAVDVWLEQEDDAAVAQPLNEAGVLLTRIANFTCRGRPIIMTCCYGVDPANMGHPREYDVQHLVID
jgi:hypothetical protein